MEDSEVGSVASSGQIEQFVSDVLLYSSQYGNSSSISYTAINLIGKPRVYPRYGDSHEAYSPRTYGPWWDRAPSACKPIQTQNMARIPAKDFVVVGFEEAVFPSQVSVYETFNPGSVVRIWAAAALSQPQSQNVPWRLLYEGEPQNPEKRARIFSPPLRNIPFPTKTLRLDLSHSHLTHHCQLDAVKLSGTSPSRMGVMAALRITDLARVKPVPQPEPVREPVDSNQTSLLSLPQELVHCILTRLDLPSLSRVACTCRRLRTLASDWTLYSALDLTDQWRCMDAASGALAKRCQRLTKLRIVGAICLPTELLESLDGERLTHLWLDTCACSPSDRSSISVLNSLGSRCPNLRQLAVRGMPGFPTQDSLVGLQRLDRLDLYRSSVSQSMLLAALASNPRLQHLNIGSCEAVADMDAVAEALADCNAELVSLDAWKSRGWTSAGLRSLARLSRLQDLDLGWSLGDEVGGLLPLVDSCRAIRKLGLAACRGTGDLDVCQLAHNASQLQQLDLTGVKGLSESALVRALTSLSRLQLLDLSFCGFPPTLVERWRRDFPSVQINSSSAP